MGRKRTACGTCASIKAKCSRGTPCKRCERLALQCDYDETLETRPRDSKAQVQTKGKVWHTRSADGCLACRKKRRKCDEQKPVCSACVRSNIPCVPAGAKQLKHLDITLFRPDCHSEDTATPSTLGHIESPASSELHPNAEFPSSSHFLDWIALLGHDDHVEWARSGNLANSTASARLPMPHTADDIAGLDAYLPPTSLNELTGTLPSNLKTWGVAERHLLNHFLQSVARALVVVDDTDNPFLEVITPLALENKTVKHALLALSASHLSQVYPDWGKDVLDHRSYALQHLKDEIESLEHIMWSLAATLLLCLLEICEARSKVWLLHLHGAYALLERYQDSQDIDPQLDALIEMYNYICCVASLTCDKVPSSFTGKLSKDYEDGCQDMHPFLGLSADLYRYLGHINKLYDRLQGGDAVADFQQVRREAHEIETALQSHGPLADRNLQQWETEAKAAELATQWAVIMRLQKITKSSTSETERKKMTDNILSALSTIRTGSQMEARLLFPLFMAGIGSNTKVSRLTVEYRINVMETTIGFRNIVLAHRLLDEIWRLSNEGTAVDWEHLMRTRYPNLVLF